MAGDRHVEVLSPLGTDVFFQRLTVTEELGRPFEMHLELLSKNYNIELSKALGQAFSIQVETRAGNERFFHGIASRFSLVGSVGNLAHYSVTLNPWLWLLTRTANCRIFQNETVPDIIKKVFRDHGFTDFKDSLAGNYEPRVYCVQYGESDFNFISRLMEHEGIYYFFEYEKSTHTLVLSDAYGAHSTVSKYEKIAFYPPDVQRRRKEEHFRDVTIAEQIQPGAYVVDSFDFEKPKANLQSNSVSPRSHDYASFEIYDYQADYAESSDASTYAKVRLEEFQSRYEIVSATGDACGVGTGNLFTLDGHPRQTLNQQYLIVSSSHEIAMHGYESGSGSSGLYLEDSIRIEAIESQQQFRCDELTPKPAIYGPQTAIVVGKKGEEIWTDEHGRVKVQFHWDREGKRDENSSCWLRVAQVWAGKGWGGIALPRIGQEVIVHFMAGDPDQPVVTGRVYNKEHKVPYDLPANQTQSGIKTRSTKTGSAENFNELRFEDKKGEEQVYFHAEKDFERVVENNDTLTVDEGDRSAEIKMGNDALVIKQGDRTTNIDLGKSTTEAMQSIEFKVGQSSVKLDQQGVTIKGMMIKIEGMTMSEMKSPMTTVKGDGMLTVKGGITMIN